MAARDSDRPSTLDRRDFLSIVAPAAVTSACGDDDGRAGKPRPLPPPDPSPEWAEVRGQFDLSPDKIHLSALYIASHPRTVRNAIDRHRRGLDADPVNYLNENIGSNERQVLSRAAQYFGVADSNVALTDSTTMGLGLIYNGLDVRAGQEVLTTENNYYSTDEALRLKAASTGAIVRRVPMYQSVASATEGEIVDNIIRSVSPATRAVALTWVHSSTGLKLPLRSIADRLTEINAARAEAEQVLLCVDGVHGFGVEDVELASLGCDLFAAGCHKWLFGPRGTGVVYGSERGWRSVRGTIPTFMDDRIRDAWITGADIPTSMNGRRFSPGGFKAYEHQWAMAEAFDLHFDIGKKKIADRTHELSRQLKEGLAAMEHVRLYTPMSDQLSSGIVCFDVDGMSPYAVVNRLAERNIVATVTPYADPYTRIAPCIYNTNAEIDTVLREIRSFR